MLPFPYFSPLPACLTLSLLSHLITSILDSGVESLRKCRYSWEGYPAQSLHFTLCMSHICGNICIPSIQATQIELRRNLLSLKFGHSDSGQKQFQTFKWVELNPRPLFFRDHHSFTLVVSVFYTSFGKAPHLPSQVKYLRGIATLGLSPLEHLTVFWPIRIQEWACDPSWSNQNEFWNLVRERNVTEIAALFCWGPLAFKVTSCHGEPPHGRRLCWGGGIGTGWGETESWWHWAPRSHSAWN